MMYDVTEYGAVRVMTVVLGGLLGMYCPFVNIWFNSTGTSYLHNSKITTVIYCDTSSTSTCSC